MRLFLIAFALSAMANLAFGQNPSRDQGNSGSQPIRSPRFERSEAQMYIMQRARGDSEHRAALLRYYDSVGFDYGAPVINSNFYFQNQPPQRYRRVYWAPTIVVPTYGM
ncbi:MAG: hypothetical protein ACK553_16205 [Planctomycetota bacterium]|jgi:hypothetical protein